MKLTLKQFLESKMPPGVIREKQKLAAMRPHELVNHFKNRSEHLKRDIEQCAREQAWSHGYGKMHPHYWNQIKDHIENETTK